MKEKTKLKYGALADETGRILDETLWEMETKIESENNLISNFIVKSEGRNVNATNMNSKKRSICNNNSEVELLDKFIKMHEKEIEKIRKFEI